MPTSTLATMKGQIVLETILERYRTRISFCKQFGIGGRHLRRVIRGEPISYRLANRLEDWLGSGLIDWVGTREEIEPQAVRRPEDCVGLGVNERDIDGEDVQTVRRDRQARSPLLCLEKSSDNGNVYGFDALAIIQFGIDRFGSAIGIWDGQHLDYIHGTDLKEIMFGSDPDGVPYYRLAA